jgi:hypothetical protein
MQKAPRTILATLTAFVIANVILYLFKDSNRDDLSFVQYLILGLVYGFPILCLGILMFCIVNYITQKRIQRKRFRSIHLFYFVLSIIFGCIPVLGFAVFDYAQRGRYFHDPTFIELLSEYLPTLFLTAIGTLTNWQFVWGRFKIRS